MTQPWEIEWGLRQRLSLRLGQAHGKADCPYSCPWWADEHVYALAFLQARGFGLDGENSHISKSMTGQDEPQT